jgi:Tfp pilus assembly protein PilF
MRCRFALLFAFALGLAATGALAPSGVARAAGSPDRSSDDAKPPAEYTKGLEYVKSGKLEAARIEFERAARKAPKDADVLNMLAYSQRKTGQLDQAIHNYQKALKLRPKFPQAREYLGEAYLQAALRELGELEGYGDEASKERDQLIRALEAAASRETWSAGDDTPPKPAW